MPCTNNYQRYLGETWKSNLNGAIPVPVAIIMMSEVPGSSGSNMSLPVGPVRSTSSPGLERQRKLEHSPMKAGSSLSKSKSRLTHKVAVVPCKLKGECCLVMKVHRTYLHIITMSCRCNRIQSINMGLASFFIDTRRNNTQTLSLPIGQLSSMINYNVENFSFRLGSHCSFYWYNLAQERRFCCKCVKGYTWINTNEGFTLSSKAPWK